MAFAKVVLLNYLPLTGKIARDFHLEFLHSNGVSIEYWDISEIYFPGFTLIDAITPIYLRRFTSMTGLVFSIRAYHQQFGDRVLFIPQMTREWKILSLLREFSRLGCKIAFFDVGALPNSSMAISRVEKLKRIILSGKLIETIQTHAKKKILGTLQKIRLIKEYDMVFAAGSLAAGRWRSVGVSQVVDINSIDFDRCINLQEVKRVEGKERYAVFLDEYLPHHPDLAMQGLNYISAEVYYQTMNLFFDQIEEKYSVKVWIAAHPKANYREDNPFLGRTTVSGQTAELVKDAELVLAHASTSVGFAALFKKPVLFLNFAELARVNPHIHSLMLVLAREFHAPIIDIEHTTLPEKISVNEHRLNLYVQRYLSDRAIPQKYSGYVLLEMLNQ